MRLLTFHEDGGITTTSFNDNDIPLYAVLSHTWGEDNDEVTLADIENSVGEDKPGYKKIWFCGEQAQKDGLQYCWIDTCCIDTTNKAEHSYAIRSMFRWYQAAEKCYVYLPDVCGSSWESAFMSSRWFTRGWTLQELLAPNIVEFFSADGERLGDKSSLKLLVHKITTVPIEVLEGALLSQSSVNERLRWADGRVTRRDEDRAYSLQGIFDVELAPVYGEGAAGAFERLRTEIYKLEKCI